MGLNVTGLNFLKIGPQKVLSVSGPRLEAQKAEGGRNNSCGGAVCGVVRLRSDWRWTSVNPNGLRVSG